MTEITVTIEAMPFKGVADVEAVMSLWMTVRPLDMDTDGRRLMDSLHYVEGAYVDEETDHAITYGFDCSYWDMVAGLSRTDPRYAGRFPTSVPVAFKEGKVRLTIRF